METWEITLGGAALAKGLCSWVKTFGSVSAGVRREDSGGDSGGEGVTHRVGLAKITKRNSTLL